MSTRVELRSEKDVEIQSIRAASLSKSFGNEEAVRNASFDVATGKTTALIGANGSGKSTLLKMLFGLCVPDEGELSVCGLDPNQESKRLYAFTRFLSQQVALDGEMTGHETLSLFASLSGVPRDKFDKQLANVSQQFGIHDFLSRRIASLSGGMKQRIHLSICLLGDSKLMLLDEPTSNLDPDGELDFWKWTRDYTDNGGTIVLSTHDLKNAERHASQVILLDQGRILLDDDPQTIIQLHGRHIIFATVDNGEYPKQAKAKLESMETVSKVDCNGNQIAIVLVDEHCNDAAVIAELEKQNIPVRSYRRETGLAAAYYLLAGKRLKSQRTSENGSRHGKRRRR